jgi:CopG family nickel-responsive transcriptional regulator
MENVTRIGVSLEPDLLRDFDSMIKEKGYGSRSEAIRDIIRDTLVADLVKDEDAEVVGTITLVYPHHKGNVQENLMEIQHEHHASISSTIHVHLDLEKCLEVLVVWGRVGDVKRLSDALTSVKGVLHGKLTMTTGKIEAPEHHH